MESNTALVLTSLALGLFCVVALVEHALYGGLNRFYYTHGLPLITARLPVVEPQQEIPPAERFGSQLRSELIGSLGFRQIAPDTHAFHRQFFRPGLLPGTLMHGMIQFDRANKQVVLKAFINIWVPLLILAVIVFSVLGPFGGWFRLLFPITVFLVFGTPLWLERRRCMAVAQHAAREWEARQGG